MDSKILQYSLKIKKLLRKFLEPNFHVRSDADFNILLSHLAGKNDPGLLILIKTCAYLLILTIRAATRFITHNIINLKLFA